MGANKGSLRLSEDQKLLKIVPRGTSGTEYSGNRFFEEYRNYN